MKYFLLALLAFPVTAHSQKKFSLALYLPHSIQKEKLQISYYNGKETKDVRINNNSDSIILRDIYYSEHVIVHLQYFISTPDHPDYAVFYVDDQPAEIRIPEAGPSKDVFSKVSVKNAVNAAPLGMDQMRAYTEKEHASVMEGFKKMQDSQGNDSLFAEVRIKTDIELGKKLDYIINHGKQYYAFYVFGEGYLNSKLVSVDSLLYIFNHVFPSKFRNNYEGKKMLSLLNIRKLREQQRVAPDFTVLDINNKTISLHQYKNKYVLINFWASWCVPCVKEFPTLNKITGEIPGDKLVKIFITEDSDTLAFENARKKYNVQGIHLFANKELIKKYKAEAIPQLYLIDKEGKIIYDKGDLHDVELTQLAAIIHKIPELH
jgi:thiol-disulfide isomerase/thioredoxin